MCVCVCGKLGGAGNKAMYVWGSEGIGKTRENRPRKRLTFESLKDNHTAHGRRHYGATMEDTFALQSAAQEPDICSAPQT